MMTDVLHKTRKIAAIACIVGGVGFGTAPAFAQCEMPVTAAAAAAVQAAQGAAVLALSANGSTPVGTVNAAVDLSTASARSAVISTMNLEWGLMKAYMNNMWSEWNDSMRKQTAQLHAGQIDQTRQMSSNYDSSQLGEVTRDVQQTEFQAKKEYIPTEDGCRFDTVGKRMTTSSMLSQKMAQGYSADFSKLGNNRVGTPAEKGQAEMLRARYDNYATKFCDGNSNGGTASCAPGLPMANAHILPGKTLFGNETIDMDNPDVADAINQLLFNITDYTVPDPMKPDVVTSSAGQEARRVNRENMAQMDAIGALAWSLVGERTKGQPAADVQQMRQVNGATGASANPSEKEIRTAVVEQLWNPKFYVQLTNGSATTGQKELYLKAYSLGLLYKVVEKTEKIANAYAIETANLLQKHDSSRGNLSNIAPAK